MTIDGVLFCTVELAILIMAIRNSTNWTSLIVAMKLEFAFEWAPSFELMGNFHLNSFQMPCLSSLFIAQKWLLLGKMIETNYGNAHFEHLNKSCRIQKILTTVLKHAFGQARASYESIHDQNQDFSIFPQVGKIFWFCAAIFVIRLPFESTNLWAIFSNNSNWFDTNPLWECHGIKHHGLCPCRHVSYFFIQLIAHATSFWNTCNDLEESILLVLLVHLDPHPRTQHTESSTEHFISIITVLYHTL